VVEQPAPPPLPKGQDAAPPVHAAPPPLTAKRTSTYVMKGSGEGRTEGDAPWTAAPEAEEAPLRMPPAQPVALQPAPEAGKIQFQLPTITPEEELPPEKPAAVEVHKPKRTGLWVILVILLVGAGGFAAWYFVKQSKLLAGDQGDDQVKPAGVVPAETPGKPTEEEAADAGIPDAGEEKAADEEPGETKAAGAGEEEAKKDEKKGDAAKKKKKKKIKEVAKREVVKRPAEIALDHYKKGNALIRKKRFQEAIALFKKALKANSKLAIAHRGLGICYAQMRDNKKACREYSIYLKMIPQDSKEVPTLKQILKSCK
jgi:hypothetical protein